MTIICIIQTHEKGDVASLPPSLAHEKKGNVASLPTFLALEKAYGQQRVSLVHCGGNGAPSYRLWPSGEYMMAA